jgi:carbonic anhydrase/acetyltransferase-like protein (isoleucine patch superfamily)
MEDNVVFHALEEADLHFGNNIKYGERVIIHGGWEQLRAVVRSRQLLLSGVRNNAILERCLHPWYLN